MKEKTILQIYRQEGRIIWRSNLKFNHLFSNDAFSFDDSILAYVTTNLPHEVA
jgi:hypothetical protein